MLTLATSATGVGTLRLRGAGRDSPALRLAASSRLAGADLRPAALPPAAILVVRRMADPRPGRFSAHHREPGIDREWELRARAAVSEAAARAARPRRGRLPPNADAVLFRDGAELLACLVSAASGGGATREWWKPAVAGFLPVRPAERPAAMLRAAPRELPAALADLAAWGRAREVLAQLTAPACAEALAELVAAHGLPPELLPDDGRAAPAPGGAPRAAGPEAVPPPAPIPAGGPPEPPWRPWLPAAAEAGLDRSARALLGIGLALHRAPGEVRSARFAHGAARWWRSDGAGPADPGAGDPAATRPRSPHLAAPGAQDAWRGPAGEPAAGRPDPEGRPAIGRDVPESSPSRLGAGRPGGGAAPAEGTSAGPASSAPPVPGPPDGAVVRPPHAEAAGMPGLAGAASEPEEEDAGAAILPALDPGLPTRIGGLLYLVHLMTRLDLPAVFAADWGLDRSPGAWGLLELLARGLLEPLEDGFRDDPAWRALAELAGREPGTLPAADSEGPSAYRLPPAWLPVLGDHGLLAPDSRFAWAAAAGRLRVWCAAGWLLLDRSLGGARPAELAQRELASALGEGPFALRRAPFGQAPLARPPGLLAAGLEPSLGRWLGAVLPAVELLLDRVAGPFEAPGGAAAALLLCPGRLHVTRTHVDLVAPLAAISLPARRSGLDRDPGWLPAFGRIVSFHFED